MSQHEKSENQESNIKYVFELGKIDNQTNHLNQLNSEQIIEKIVPDIELLASSSKGNSVFIKPLNLLVDLGLPFKRYSEINPDYFLKVNYIVITHIHTDHLNETTLKKILENYPHIKVFLTEFSINYISSDKYKKGKSKLYDILKKHYQNIIQVNTINSAVSCYKSVDNQLKILFYNVSHGDIVNIALEFFFKSNVDNSTKKVLYSTDIDTVNSQYYLENELKNYTDIYQNGVKQKIFGLPLEKISFDNVDNKYDLILLEANYNKELLNQQIEEVKTQLNSVILTDKIRKNLSNRLIRMESNKRHISEKQAFNYVYKNLKEGGLFIPLHASREFGTFYQDNFLKPQNV